MGDHRDGLILAAYDAAVGAGSWDEVLRLLDELFGAWSSVLLSQQLDASNPSIKAVTGIDDSVRRSYEEYFGRRNVFMLRGRHLLKRGIVRTNEMMCPDADLFRTEYYADFLRPNDIRYLLGTTLWEHEGTAVHLTIFRAHDHRPFDEDDRQELARIAPHLVRATAIEQQIAGVSARCVVLEQVLEGMARGAAAVDTSGRLLYVNRSLERMLAARDGLSVSRGQLVCGCTRTMQALKHAIAEAASRGNGRALPVPRPSGATPYTLMVAPLRPEMRIEGVWKTPVLVTVTEPAAYVPADPVVLQDTLGLTPTEARIAIEIAGGRTVRDVADRAGISVLTVKTHLKRIFVKTGVKRQAELVHRIQNL